MSVATPQEDHNSRPQGLDSGRAEIAAPGGAQPAICPCGCKQPLPEGRKWAGPKCRMVAFELAHPRVDLSGLDPVKAKKAERMMAEAIRAAKLGQSRATVDARHPVEHEEEAKAKDRRSSNRIRLSDEEWRQLEFIRSYAGKGSRTEVVQMLLAREWRSPESQYWQGQQEEKDDERASEANV